MKKYAALLLTALLLIPCFVAAEDVEGRARVCWIYSDTYYPVDPVVTLYAQPDTASEAVAQLFDDTWVDVIADDGGPFVRVRCDAFEGYLLRAHLLFGVSGIEAGSYSGAYAAFSVPAPATSIALLDAPNGNVTTQLPLFEDTASVDFFAQDFAHITYQDQSGYVPATAVRQTDNFASCVLVPNAPSERIPLHADPNDPASLIGEYFGYQRVYNLFTPMPIYDNFKRVTFGRVSGYVPTHSVATGAGIHMPFVPPMVQTAAETTLYADIALTQALETIPAQTQLKILGELTMQDAYHVQWGAIDAFVRKADLTDAPQEAPISPYLSLYRTTRETRLFTSREESQPVSANTPVYLLDSGYAYNSFHACYVYLPETHEMGHIEESALLLVQSGEELSETSPMPGLFGNRRLYAAQGAELRAAPSDEAEVLFTFDTSDESCYLLGGVLPNGYIHVQSTTDTTLEGYILADWLDYAHW